MHIKMHWLYVTIMHNLLLKIATNGWLNIQQSTGKRLIVE